MCLALILGAASPAARGATPSAADWPEAVLEVGLSTGGPRETMVVLRGPSDVLYLEEADFARLRLHLPPVPAHEQARHRYFAPAALAGCRVSVDEARQQALIAVPPDTLATTFGGAASRPRLPVTPAAPGAFLNYQLSAQQIMSGSISGAFAELGLFAGEGVLTNSAIGRAETGGRQLVRLDSTFTRDFPDSLQTLALGDSIGDPGSWGNSVRFAGLRFSRNFALRPDLLTTPLLSTGGTATVPSSVDVFVNNQLVNSSQLPAGPFIIDRLPAISGAGEVSVVVRDALGREQVVSQAFYSSLELLARGLTQYSVDLGSVRENYALQSDRYGTALAEGTYRRGITDTVTLEGHGEYLDGQAHAAGLSAAFALGHIAILDVTAAGGGVPNGGTGWLSGVGLQHRGPSWSIVADTRWTSRDFADIGEPAERGMRPHQRSLLQGGVGLGRYGSLSLAYVAETYQSAPAQQTVGLTHSVGLGRFGNVNLTLARTHSASFATAAAQTSASAYLLYVYAFDGRHTVSATAVSGSGPGAPRNEAIGTLSQSPPVGPGSGYRVRGSTAGDYDADFREQTRALEVEVEAARNQGVSGRSVYVSGALTWLDGRVDATRAVNGSFAMVDVAGLPDVPVYVEHQLTAHTDASGQALLYNLRPYEANRISIEPTELPLDTAIASSSTVIAPPYRSGVVARFPVARVRSATFRLVTEEGAAVAVGARVRLSSQRPEDEGFPVVLDGVVYVTGLDRDLEAVAAWSGGECRFHLASPPPHEVVPDLGTVVCRR